MCAAARFRMRSAFPERRGLTQNRMFVASLKLNAEQVDQPLHVDNAEALERGAGGHVEHRRKLGAPGNDEHDALLFLLVLRRDRTMGSTGKQSQSSNFLIWTWTCLRHPSDTKRTLLIPLRLPVTHSIPSTPHCVESKLKKVCVVLLLSMKTLGGTMHANQTLRNLVKSPPVDNKALVTRLAPKNACTPGCGHGWTLFVNDFKVSMPKANSRALSSKRVNGKGAVEGRTGPALSSET